MATWLMHMMIGDRLMKEFPKLDPEAYVVGSVGADAGDVTEVKGVFDPPAFITHWTHKGAGPDKSCCRYMDFYEAYIKNETDLTKWSFYVGYYIHLQTDVLWHRLVYAPLLDRYRQSILDASAILNRMRQSSAACELEYLKLGNTFKLWEVMKQMDHFSAPVLPYYHSMSLTNHIRLIHSVYSPEAVASYIPFPDRMFFLEDWLAFADQAVEEIREINRLNGLCFHNITGTS